MRDGMEKRLAESYGMLAPDERVREDMLGSLASERASPASPLLKWTVSTSLVAVALLLVVVLQPWLVEPVPSPGNFADVRLAARFETDGDAAAVMEIMRKRLDALEVGGEVWSEEVPGGIELYLPPGSNVDEVTAALLRRGTLEFRLVIEDPSSGEGTRVRAEDGEEWVVVDAVEFSGEDLDPDSIGSRPDTRSSGRIVDFAMRDHRMAAFESFTSENVQRRLAIILDGVLHSAPTIQSPLPGEGIITGGGPEGFTEEEAESLVSVLRSGAYPAEVRPR